MCPQEEYLPFGETWTHEGDTKHSPKYNSQELDKETNYYFYNARHYDPEICRFVTADDRIDGEDTTQGWNRYAYVKNNPIVYKDPTGHLTIQFGVSSIVGAGAGVTSGGGFIMSISKEGIEFGGYASYGGGLMTGASAGVSVQLSISGNDRISDVSGKSITGGGSGGAKLSVGAEISRSITDDGIMSSRIKHTSPVYSLHVGVGAGIEGHAFVTDTIVNKTHDIKFRRETQSNTTSQTRIAKSTSTMTGSQANTPQRSCQEVRRTEQMPKHYNQKLMKAKYGN